MPSVRPIPLPPDALLQRHAAAGYTDCWVLDHPRAVTHAEFVRAFYTTPLFRLERQVLRWAFGKPSRDEEAQALALGQRDTFAAWSVEGRAPDQLLLRDHLAGRTRSWLMTAPGATPSSTRLMFGSAVVPLIDRKTGRASMGAAFHLLQGFHVLYSRALLRAAARRLG